MLVFLFHFFLTVQKIKMFFKRPTKVPKNSHNEQQNPKLLENRPPNLVILISRTFF